MYKEEENIYVCTYFQRIVNNIGYMLTVCGILLVSSKMEIKRISSFPSYSYQDFIFIHVSF